MILRQVADNRTKKGMVNISAVVDSGAEANALPENMMEWIPLKPSSASKSGKIFRGAGRDPIPARGERSVTGRTDEGQSRRIVWEVFPVKRPLLSVAKITKAGNQVYLGEDKACVKNNKTGMGPVLVRPLLAPVDEECAPREDGEGGEDESMQEGVEEGRRPLFRKSENQPSSQEVQEHMKTHIPYRSRCAHCIRGGGMIPTG